MDWKNYTKPEIAAACLRWGPILDQHLDGTDDGNGQVISGAQLLFALAGRESSFGKNCKPRHEPAYDWGGKYAREPFQNDLLVLYDSEAAKSYGPWQIMLCNAVGWKPRELAEDLEHAAVATIGFIRRQVLGAQKARTLEQIADTYNSGNYRDRVTPDVAAYIAAVKNFYFTEVIDAGPATLAAESGS
jgi:hypothetical protein